MEKWKERGNISLVIRAEFDFRLGFFGKFSKNIKQQGKFSLKLYLTASLVFNFGVLINILRPK